MATRTIYTDIFRLSYPHLDKPQPPTAQQALQGQVGKYGIAMMFPKSGTGVIETVGQFPSAVTNIMQALEEVCQEQWQLTFEQATAVGMGINFPPKFKDGDQVWQKDPATKQPIHGQVAPESAGMWILSAKNPEPVGTVDPTGTVDINPTALYAGCWAKAQLEVSAYDGNNGRVLVIKLLNVMMAYDDTNFGGKPNHAVGAAAFAGQAITNTNVQAGVGQTGAIPAIQAPQPVAAPAAPAPAAPAAPAPAAPVAAPAAPAAPAPAAPVAAPAAPAPAAPAPVAAPVAAPSADPVIMNAGEASYAEHVKLGWTAEMLIAQGKATANYLNPAS